MKPLVWQNGDEVEIAPCPTDTIAWTKYHMALTRSPRTSSMMSLHSIGVSQHAIPATCRGNTNILVPKALPHAAEPVKCEGAADDTEGR